MRTLLLAFAFASSVYAGDPVPSPSGTPLPMPTAVAAPAVPVEISLAAITAGNQVVIDGFIKGSPYYFHITFDVFETVGPLGRLLPATKATSLPTATPK